MITNDDNRLVCGQSGDWNRVNISVCGRLTISEIMETFRQLGLHRIQGHVTYEIIFYLAIYHHFALIGEFLFTSGKNWNKINFAMEKLLK